MSLELRQVLKAYRTPDGATMTVLDIPEFIVATGEQVALIGPSGSGKSTLLNAIAGITRVDSGEIRIGGTDICRLSEVARDRLRAERIGFVYQSFNLLPAFTALENVLLGMSFGGKSSDRGRAMVLLERVGLGQRLHHKPTQLSVGEQQRVAVARALANQPKLLLADEPTASVDRANQQTILDLIRETCREGSVSLLLVTHAGEVAEQLDRVEQLTNFNRAGAAK